MKKVFVVSLLCLASFGLGYYAHAGYINVNTEHKSVNAHL